MTPGRRNLITDVPGVLVGNAGDARLKSGVTVLTSDAPFAASVDIRGGAPGTRDVALLAPGRLVEEVSALVLSGGSAFGLDAAGGVSDRLRAAGRGFAVGPAVVPIVPAAILFDLANGGDKDWASNPYPALGAAAFDAAGEAFGIGTHGAGTGASTANWKGGLGSASLVSGGASVGALVAVNAVGTATPPGSRHFWAGAWEMGGEFGGLGPVPQPAPAFAPGMVKLPLDTPLASTTIAIVATDVALDKTALARMAAIAHDGIARALVPAHTPYDGDLVFAVSTGRRPVEGLAADSRLVLEQAAAQCLARAIARGVYAATPAPGDRLPCWRDGKVAVS